MAKKFASAGDMADKKISFTEIGKDLWAFTAEGDPEHRRDHRRRFGDGRRCAGDAAAGQHGWVEKIRTVHRQADQITCF